MLKTIIKLKYYLYNLFTLKKHRKINIEFFGKGSWVISTSAPILSGKILLGYKITFLFSTDNIKLLNELNFDDILNFDITATKLLNFCLAYTEYFFKSSVGIKNINQIISNVTKFDIMHGLFYENMRDLKQFGFIMDQDKKYNFLVIRDYFFKMSYYNYQFKYHSKNEEPGTIIINNIYANPFQNMYWYQNGLLHRIDEPAVIIEESKKYYQNGKLHNSVGPAIQYYENVDKKNCYYLKGKKIYSEESELNSIKKKEKIIEFKSKYSDFLKDEKLQINFS